MDLAQLISDCSRSPERFEKPLLMLAPMQGLTNRALRSYFIRHVRPDIVFTEFMRVNAAAEVKRLAPADLRQMAEFESGVPLVVQLVGHGIEPLVSAAKAAQDAGAVNINLNVGCPYGRMTTGYTGGGMLRRPEDLTSLIPALREAVKGSFSIKIRAGYDNPEQIFSLLDLFESSGVDFIVLHPRTVVQEYEGFADHAVTARVVSATRIPVIANGDIRNAADGKLLMKRTAAAGLMLGRGAIAEPRLFSRLRGEADHLPNVAVRMSELGNYLREMLELYRELFCGDMQVLGKLKAIVKHIEDDDLARLKKKLSRASDLKQFASLLP